MRQLLALCSEREPHVACTVRRMAMASLVAVFRDITPRSAMVGRGGVAYASPIIIVCIIIYIAGVLR